MNTTTIITILISLAIIITGYYVGEVLFKRSEMSYDENGDPVKRLPGIVYYTVQTNIMAMLYLILVVLARLGVTGMERIAYHPAVALPMAIYITITTLVYWGVLLPMLGVKDWFFSFSNVWLHTITTIIVLITLHNVHGQNMSHVFGALVYPAFYLVLSLIVARNTGKYTYPFLNPAVMGGWGGVLAACVGMVGLFLGLGWGYVHLINRLH